jgi:hypothetical protein
MGVRSSKTTQSILLLTDPFYTKEITNKAGKIYTATEIEILSSIPSTSIVVHAAASVF